MSLTRARQATNKTTAQSLQRCAGAADGAAPAAIFNISLAFFRIDVIGLFLWRKLLRTADARIL